MSVAERDEFLAVSRLSRLSTNRADGWPHTAPTWFLWAEGTFIHSIGPGRRHLRNLEHSTKVTECIDVDDRLSARDLGARAAAIVCFGEAEIISNPDQIELWNERMLSHYLGTENAAPYLELGKMEIPLGRRIVRVHPRRWLTWDYAKVEL